jgi:hypothetical protein
MRVPARFRPFRYVGSRLIEVDLVNLSRCRDVLSGARLPAA